MNDWPRSALEVARNLYFNSLYRWRSRGGQPVLVYSLGKVGTTSLLEVIRQHTSRPVLQVHRVGPLPVAMQIDDAGGTRRSIPRVARRGAYVHRLLSSGAHSDRWDVVCGVRDPVARAVSSMFELGQLSAGSRRGEPHEAEHREALPGELDRLAELFTTRRAGLNWFEAQLARVTGIDVYATPFDHARGFQTYSNDRFRVLVIRNEDLNRVGPRALAEFFDLAQPPPMPTANEGSPAQRAFVADAEIPLSVLALAYESRLARHFYTESERAQMRCHWNRTECRRARRN